MNRGEALSAPLALPTEMIAHLGAAGDCCAAGFQLAYVRFGSISTELTEVARPFMSAMPPRATKWMRHNAVSAAGLSVVRRTRIAPEIVLATTTHEFVRQLPLAPQFGDELRVRDRMCLRSDRTAAVSCTYPVHEHGLVARVPNGKRRCDRVTQETGTAYQE